MASETRYIELKSSCGLKKICIILRELIRLYVNFLLISFLRKGDFALIFLEGDVQSAI